ETVGQRDDTTVTERANRSAFLDVQRKQAVPAIQKDTELSPIAPECSSSQFPAATGQDLTKRVRFAIESPQFLAGFSVQRRNAVVRRRHVQHTVDHEGRRFEEARGRAKFCDRRLPVLPLPGHLQALNVLRVDVRQRRVFHAAWIAAVVEPSDLRRRAGLREEQRSARSGKKYDKKGKLSASCEAHEQTSVGSRKGQGDSATSASWPTGLKDPEGNQGVRVGAVGGARPTCCKSWL